MTPLALLLTLSALLFSLGLLAVLTRRNVILILVGIELMLNAANLNFIAFWRYGPPEAGLTGPVFVLFSIAIAAAEAAAGLAIVLMVFRHTRSTDLNRLDSLHG
ncbi:MAG: NADH-quinone oxidoreductase subunit NuoK [Akkermansiaceae bacterium]|nr:NADH-quinone oxidoreductase subunit NuoK [Akkermansiaceae bacterium]MCF7732030.1 NADH-quinone oxidoreductase subunit NuoK [Akkermansiaceae bacterium]